MKAAQTITLVLASVLAVCALGQKATAPPVSKDEARTEKNALVKLNKAYMRAKVSLHKTKDPRTKSAFGVAATNYGTAVMNAVSITDRAKKYTFALHLFREALVADPTNAEAQKNKDLIESIYKSMGKPIPK